MSVVWRWILVPLAAVAAVGPGGTRGPVVTALGAGQGVNCSALLLHVAPGQHPASAPNVVVTAPDAPRTPFVVAVPLFPGLTPLHGLAGSPFGTLPGSPYVQTASAEFHTTADSFTVESWYQDAMPGCGWRADGSWGGNTRPFPDGIAFARGPVDTLGVEIGFADTAHGGTDVGIGVWAVRYPIPPPRARLHGPFVRLNIALMQNHAVGSAGHVIHSTVTSRQAIAQVVAAIDRIRAAYTESAVCFGGFRWTGPAWLTFVRADGAQIHAYEIGPGECGGLAVNGFRWLLDRGKVWNLITRPTSGRG